jgi:cAMP phosphodiesterase
VSLLSDNLGEQIHEVADLAINPDGYADDVETSARHNHQRQQLEALLRAVVEAFLQTK